MRRRLSLRFLSIPCLSGFECGQTLAQLFENAAAALQSIAVEIDDVRAAGQFVLSASGPDAEALLVNWLNEVLFLERRPGYCVPRIPCPRGRTHACFRDWLG